MKTEKYRDLQETRFQKFEMKWIVGQGVEKEKRRQKEEASEKKNRGGQKEGQGRQEERRKRGKKENTKSKVEPYTSPPPDRPPRGNYVNIRILLV